jgi:hypothetical protein
MIILHDQLVQKIMMPPMDFVTSGELPAAVNNIITLSRACVAAELSSSGTDGYLEVHPVQSEPGKWYQMPLVAGQRNMMVYDQIRTTSATGKVDIAQVTHFPIQL